MIHVYIECIQSDNLKQGKISKSKTGDLSWHSTCQVGNFTECLRTCVYWYWWWYYCWCSDNTVSYLNFKLDICSRLHVRNFLHAMTSAEYFTMYRHLPNELPLALQPFISHFRIDFCHIFCIYLFHIDIIVIIVIIVGSVFFSLLRDDKWRLF